MKKSVVIMKMNAANRMFAKFESVSCSDINGYQEFMSDLTSGMVKEKYSSEIMRTLEKLGINLNEIEDD